jgi:hypothetical protein
MRGSKEIEKTPKGGLLGGYPLGNIEKRGKKGGKDAWEFYGR